MSDLYEVVRNSFKDYAGAVILDRAIVDVRDCVKPSARTLLYYQYKKKNTKDKPYVKSAKIVGGVLGDYYIHGDSSAYGIYTRLAQTFAMRYPLEDFQGNVGNMMGDPPAAMRYTEMRLNTLSSEHIFQGLNKNAINEWKNNFDETEVMPAVLPSIGFYNICNGSIGLGIGVSSSIPQFNLKEVNAALIKLIKNPEIDFNEIYCPPDFATGGLITNAAEVKESLRNGKGAAIRIRSIIEYDNKAHALLVKELPYGVSTSTITDQINKKLEDANYGIDKYNDGTGLKPDLIIYLSKNANPSIMIKKLYHDTSLENWFGINMIMLDKGRFPKVFSWKEACQAYINHIRECKTRELEYDVASLEARNHILDGLRIALANIDDIVYLIRHSESPSEAKIKLIEKYGFSDEQVKAILDMKLQRLANLEGVKIEKEFEQNTLEVTKLHHILNTPEELNQLLIDALEEVSKRFGDERRTKVDNIIEAEEEEEEEKEVILRVNGGKISYAIKKGEGQIIRTTNLDSLIGIDKKTGKMYRVKVNEVPEKGIGVASLFRNKNICYIESARNISQKDFIFFSTSDGYLKKTSVFEINFLKGRDGIKVCNLTNEAELVEFYVSNEIPSEKFAGVPVTGKGARGTKRMIK